mmetsp:Transcript_14457/g.27992  ORF Transcript_14457/g.27992 Transcript_14457/m.27992 type:complete len:670 (-) Transcript_14457:217-2226(-)
MSLKAITASYYASKGRADHELFDSLEAAVNGQGPDERLNREISEKVSGINDPRQLAEIVRRLRKKLKSSDHNVVMNTFVLYETMMENAHADLLMAMSFRKTMQQFIKVIKSGSSKSASRKKQIEGDRALALLETWNAKYLNQPAMAKGIIDTYDLLRRKGVTYNDSSRSNGDFEEGAGARSSAASGGRASSKKSKSKGKGGTPLANANAQLSGLAFPEQASLIANVTSMLEELVFNVTSKEEAAKGDLIVELVEQCKGFQTVIAAKLSQEEDAEKMEALLKLNDRVLSVLELHKRAVTVGPPSADQKPTTFSPGDLGIPTAEPVTPNAASRAGIVDQTSSNQGWSVSSEPLQPQRSSQHSYASPDEGWSVPTTASSGPNPSRPVSQQPSRAAPYGPGQEFDPFGNNQAHYNQQHLRQQQQQQQQMAAKPSAPGWGGVPTTPPTPPTNVSDGQTTPPSSGWGSTTKENPWDSIDVGGDTSSDDDDWASSAWDRAASTPPPQVQQQPQQPPQQPQQQYQQHPLHYQQQTPQQQPPQQYQQYQQHQQYPSANSPAQQQQRQSWGGQQPSPVSQIQMQQQQQPSSDESWANMMGSMNLNQSSNSSPAPSSWETAQQQQQQQQAAQQRQKRPSAPTRARPPAPQVKPRTPQAPNQQQAQQNQKVEDNPWDSLLG